MCYGFDVIVIDDFLVDGFFGGWDGCYGFVWSDDDGVFDGFLVND